MIKIGFQNRQDTYSGLLAYVTYIKPDNTIAKSVSWESWRSRNILPKELPNDPVSGFVLNKKAGGLKTGWHVRQTKCRVWDPRGWEVEISIENLLYILQECTCDKGKGLIGEFVYSWDGKDMVLLPTHSQEYKESMALIKKTVKLKISDLVLGSSYTWKATGKDLVYIGSRSAYSPEFGKKRQYLFYSEDDGKVRDLGGLPFYCKSTTGVLSTERCAEIMDLLKDKDPGLERGVSVVGFEFASQEEFDLDKFLRELGKNCTRRYEGLRKSFLEKPERETYRNLYDFCKGRWRTLDYYIKISNTSWVACSIDLVVSGLPKLLYFSNKDI